MEPVESLSEWFATLEKTPSGRLMLTNLLHGFRTGLVPEAKLRTLFKAIVTEWASDGGRRADSVVQIIADRDNFLFCATGLPPERCSRVVDDKTLVTYNINYRDLGWPYEDEVPAGLLAQLLSGEAARAAYSFLRGGRPFAWVTPTAKLDELRRQHCDEGELACNVRDLLGLTVYQSDNLLLEIEYPEDLTSTIEFAAPTFFEGGPGVIFRARAAADRWGRAVDLRTHNDGLPEAVHAPVKFDGRFRIRRIGRIVRAQGFSFQGVIDGADFPWTSMPKDLLNLVRSVFQ